MTKNIAPLLAIDLCGLHLASPLILSAGCAGFGAEYTRIVGFSYAEIGAVCLKGTTLHPRLGNPPPRVFETPGGMLNAIGLQNPGVDYAVKTLLPLLDFRATRFIANVCGSTVEEYAEVSRRFDDSPVDALEINISCPNVKEGGVAFGNSPTMAARVVAACRAVTRKPLITKLSPNQTDIVESARHCIEAGTDAVSAINTLTATAIDSTTQSTRIANGQAGLSGPAIKPIALLKVQSLYPLCQRHGIPIIGQGGVCCAEDALEFMLAGASAIGIGTALFSNPLLGSEISRGMHDYLQRHAYSHLHDLHSASKRSPP